MYDAAYVRGVRVYLLILGRLRRRVVEGGGLARPNQGAGELEATPVRYVVYPWVVTVIQGQMGSLEGVTLRYPRGPSNVPETSVSPTHFRHISWDFLFHSWERSMTKEPSRSFAPVRLRRLLLGCHCTQV
jgi:hypothetical protein